MVPDKFNMVDMGGIDLIMMQGEAVPGLYEKLMAAISNCRYQCLYNWLFDGILIPPTYVQIEVDDDEVYLNEGVSVTSDDVIHIYSVEPAPPEPEIIPLLAEENGTYNVPSGKDGFNPVTVDVPAIIPVTEELSVTENGTYIPEEGVDGFSRVVVDVPSVTSKYIQYEPLHYDYIGGYVAGGAWNVGDTEARTDIYRVSANKKFIIHEGSSVGNRFRCAFFTSDPAEAASTLSGFNIAEFNSPQSYQLAVTGAFQTLYTAPSDGYIAIGKTNQSVNGLKSYLVEFNE